LAHPNAVVSREFVVAEPGRDVKADTTEGFGYTLERTLLGLAGAGFGVVAGYLLFLWLAGQSPWGLVLPGILMGLGCAAGSRRRSVSLALSCGLLAAAAGLLSEWSIRPFESDRSFGYFLTHLTQMPAVSLGMIALGTVAAAVLPGLGRRSHPKVLGRRTGQSEIEYALFGARGGRYAVVGFEKRDNAVRIEIARWRQGRGLAVLDDTQRIVAEFERALIISAETPRGGDDEPDFPWNITAFQSGKFTEGRWRFSLKTDRIEYRFDADWPAISTI